MAEFLMPSLGSDMVAGTLITWLKKPGDRVARGDIIAEVETDKGLIEVEVFVSGVIEQLLVAEGAKVPVGTVLATISEAEASVQAESPKAEGVPQPEPDAPRAARALTEADSGRAKATPSARRLARELGVDLTRVTSAGSDGEITREDIERAAKAKAEPTARMQQAIAAAMSRSNRDIPHYYVAHTIDLGPALAWLEATNATRPLSERLVIGALLLKATALALRKFPEFNGHYEQDRFVTSPRIHVGMAIALRGGGLVIPAIHDTDQQSLNELMHKLTDLVERARRGQLRSSELSDGTITLTSLGDRGVDSVLGVIYPPQVALVGFGTVRTRPFVVAGTVLARPLIEATVAGDHRVSDGHRAGRFLATIEQLLNRPEEL
jgi:pyruvate dehydrogenase E2 component (dihydrolipoamide acetyltransferase)